MRKACLAVELVCQIQTDEVRRDLRDGEKPTGDV